MWFIDLKINQSVEAQNLSRTNYAAVLNNSISTRNARFVPDSFTYTNNHINPAAQNPFYNIKDEILAAVFPQALVSKYTNKNFLLSAVNTNPNIKNTLHNAGSPVGVYPENIFPVTNSHFMPAVKAALIIMDNCDEKFTRKDYTTMTQAALLHDTGKAFIPPFILNKNGKLNEAEKRIVDTHTQTGYEALKSGGVSGAVLSLVKNHHNYGTQNLPMVQILQIADIYSALKEQRSYKRSFTDEEAFKILNERAQQGDFEPKYVYALQKGIN